MYTFNFSHEYVKDIDTLWTLEFRDLSFHPCCFVAIVRYESYTNRIGSCQKEKIMTKPKFQRLNCGGAKWEGLIIYFL